MFFYNNNLRNKNLQYKIVLKLRLLNLDLKKKKLNKYQSIQLSMHLKYIKF